MVVDKRGNGKGEDGEREKRGNEEKKTLDRKYNNRERNADILRAFAY